MSRIDADYGFYLVNQAMRVGIAVGAQFPAKVQPIMRQLPGLEAENGYGLMRGTVDRWLGSITQEHITLESFPLVAQWKANFKGAGVNTFTGDQTSRLAGIALMYGLVMGSSYSELFLGILESEIHAENMLVESLPSNFLPADLRKAPIVDYTQHLQNTKELVEKYEAEYGPLA